MISDIISLAIQVVGGVKVCSAQNYADLGHGSNVMRAGIIFQFCVTAVFSVLIHWTIVRLRTRGGSLVWTAGWPTTIAMVVSTGMVLVRNGYRIAELSEGWKGDLMRTEGYLIGFDLGPMAVGVGTLVVLSPCWFFTGADDATDGCMSYAGANRRSVVRGMSGRDMKFANSSEA